MRVPKPPRLAQLKQITPSLYEAARTCPARAAWAAHGSRGLLPDHPAAILGSCFHVVMEHSNKGRLPPEEAACRTAARELFDREAAVRYEKAHPLLRSKFRSPERLPYYNLFRERGVVLAVEAAGAHASRAAASSGAAMLMLKRAEAALTSRDGLVAGRPDCIDPAEGEVIDYKTGLSNEEAEGLSEVELRQLRLYAHLAFENGIHIDKGVVVRGGGARVSKSIDRTQSDAEGAQARKVLQELNSAAASGRGFAEVAEAAPSHCRMCTCIPFCEAFWEAAAPAWAEECGIHVEGRVLSVAASTVQGTPLVTFVVEVLHGTLERGAAAVEQVPEAWVLLGDDEPVKVGEVVRVVDGRRASPEPHVVVRVDRTTTVIWRMPSNP